MKVFIAYRFTGEDVRKLEPFLRAVQETLHAKGLETYCSFFKESEFQENHMTERQIFEHAFDNLASSELLLVLMTSPAKSEGMLMEVGYAFAKKIPMVVAYHSSIEHSAVLALGKDAFSWDRMEDLLSKIAEYDFEST